MTSDCTFTPLPAILEEEWKLMDSASTWVAAQLPLLSRDRLGVVFGLGPCALALKERILKDGLEMRVWIVEPSMSVLLDHLGPHDLRPLLLNGRLLAGLSLEQAVAALCQFPRLELIRTPDRYPDVKDHFDALEALLTARAARVAELLPANRLEQLRQKAVPGSDLHRLLLALPDMERVTLEAVDGWMAQAGGRWGKAERMFIALGSFR